MEIGHADGDCARTAATGATMRVVCGWCGGVMRDSRETGAATSHGLCPRCANVLEGRTPSASDAQRALEHRVNELMCRVYQTRQLLLSMQQRVGTDAQLSARIGEALASIRKQERVVAEIQQQMAAT